MRRFVPAALLCLLPALLTLASRHPPQLPPDHAERMQRSRELFAKHVRPILADNCLKCHGIGKIRGDFDLSTRETMLQGGADAPVIPGKAKASKLYRLITHQDKPHMPAQGTKLKDEQI